MTEKARNGWQRFWDKGGWWRPFLLAVVYLVVFNLISLGTSTLFAEFIDAQNPTGSASSVLFALVLPILLSGILLFLFVVSLGWAREIFGRQPGRGAGWMWIAVAIVVIPIVLRIFATDWSSYTVDTVLATLLLGLCIGFAEELISRGVAVDLLRRGGFGERAVMLLSSAVFALLHATNLLSGQPLLNVGITVVYAFGFGVMMYLVLRATGSIIWPMLLHAATDPTTILATGGVDTHGANAGTEGILAVAGVFNYLYLIFAIVAIFLVKGSLAHSDASKDLHSQVA
jgi:membrane protease YdiL (CAAX protease family)